MSDAKERLISDDEKAFNREIDPVALASKQEKKNANKRAMRKLVLATSVSFFFIAVQTAGGILSGSIAIFTDTAHLLSDIVGFAISIGCLLAA